MNEGTKASHTPSGDAPLNPVTVRFQSYRPMPSSLLPITAEPRGPFSTKAFEATHSDSKSSGNASSSGDNSGGDAVFVPGEMRQRKQSL